MLSKDKRLNLKKDFKWVASGEKVGSDTVKLFYRFGDNSTPRVGIAVSSSVYKKAVDRNRVRRLLSTAFESLYNQLPKAVNIIVMPKEGVITLSAEGVLNHIKPLLKKRSLLENGKKDNCLAN